VVAPEALGTLARVGMAAAEPGVAAPVGVVALGAREARPEELTPVDPVAVVGPVAVAVPVDPGAAEAAVREAQLAALGVQVVRAVGAKVVEAQSAPAGPVGLAVPEVPAVPVVAAPVGVAAPWDREARREELTQVDRVAVVGQVAQGSRAAPRV
jgi:hypothetical protein